MTPLDVAEVVRETLVVILQVATAPLLIMLLVGVTISILQAITQITEATLSFVPKLLGLTATLIITGPFMYLTLHKYFLLLFDRVVSVGLS